MGVRADGRREVGWRGRPPVELMTAVHQPEPGALLGGLDFGRLKGARLGGLAEDGAEVGEVDEAGVEDLPGDGGGREGFGIGRGGGLHGRVVAVPAPWRKQLHPISGEEREWHIAWRRAVCVAWPGLVGARNRGRPAAHLELLARDRGVILAQLQVDLLLRGRDGALATQPLFKRAQRRRHAPSAARGRRTAVRPNRLLPVAPFRIVVEYEAAGVALPGHLPPRLRLFGAGGGQRAGARHSPHHVRHHHPPLGRPQRVAQPAEQCVPVSLPQAEELHLRDAEVAGGGPARLLRVGGARGAGGRRVDRQLRVPLKVVRQEDLRRQQPRAGPGV
eukprot:scaffold4107_cov95-Isochrysis_galbana.AAC.8